MLLYKKSTLTVFVNSVQVIFRLLIFFLKKKEDAICASAKISNCMKRFSFALVKICLHLIKSELMHEML